MSAIPQTATIATAPPPERLARIRFCTHCGKTADVSDAHPQPYGFNRVCDRCGMGVMLSTPRMALPGSGSSAFLVVTRDGRISAVSDAAQRLVGDEAGLIGMPVTTAVTSPEDEAQFLRSLARAAGGGREVVTASVIHAGQSPDSPGRPNARIASCGPPRAALLVLERAKI